MILFVLEGAFLCANFIWFFVFFEISLVPILLMVFFWGNNPERIEAGFYLFLYILFGSLPLFLILLKISGDSTLFFNLFRLRFKVQTTIDFIYLSLAFLIKIPIFVVHL